MKSHPASRALGSLSWRLVVGLIAWSSFAGSSSAQIQGTWERPAGAPPTVIEEEPFTNLHERLGWRNLFSFWIKQEWRPVTPGSEPQPASWTFAPTSPRDSSWAASLLPGAGDLVGLPLDADLELDFCYSIAAGGNSGLKYRVPVSGDDRRAPEFQILDDRAFPELPARQRSGALYDVLDLLPAPAGAASPRDPLAHRGRIVARGNALYHERDGIPTARGLVGSVAWNQALAASKFADLADRFAMPARGRLLLQDHGSPVRFGHLFHRNLDALPGRDEHLFENGSLAGWKLIGDARYVPTEDGILGTITSGKRNAFLATERTFGDFILEVDVKLDVAGNSGIQIRSAIDGERMVGMQIEIDPSDRGWSGGLYDESRRGWLQNLEGNAAGRAAFSREGWNRYRIECVGPWIRTWINEVPIVDRLDGLDLEGHFGLQVHSGANTEIRWRNFELHELGRHRWVPAGAGFWQTGAENADDHGRLWSSKEQLDGGYRIRFAAPPDGLRVLLRAQDPASASDESAVGGEDHSLGYDPAARACVLRLGEDLERFGAPVAHHELELDVLVFGDRLTVTWGGRPVFTSHDVRGLPRRGWLGLQGVSASDIVATEVLVAD